MASTVLKIRVPSPTRILVQLVVDGQVDNIHKVEIKKEIDLDDKAVEKAVQDAAKAFSVSAYSTPVERDETVAPALTSASEKRRIKQEADAKAKASAYRRLQIAGGAIVNSVARVCEQHGVEVVKDDDGLKLRYTDPEGRAFEEWIRTF